MAENFKINVARHIEDIDDLRQKNDAGINWEKRDQSIEIADQIIEEANESNAKIVLFIASPKKRVRDTAELVRERIREESDLKSTITIENDIREIDQGDFNLPADYVPGQIVPELKEAWEIFWFETFDKENLLYRFGSTKNKYGEDIYLNLENFFISTGENYTEFCLRLYSSVLKMAENPALMKREGVKIAIMTHAAPLSIFKELEEVARKMTEEDYDFETGTLMRLCWENFNKRKIDVATKFGHIETLGIEYLYNQKIVQKLREEIRTMESSLEN